MYCHRCLRYCALFLLLAAFNRTSDAQSAYCLTDNLNQIWADDTESWEDFRRTLTTCDERGNRVIIEGQTHFFDEWDRGSRQLLAYDDADNLVERVRQIRNDDGTAYQNDKRDTYEFDDQSRRTLHLLEEWDGSSWQPVEREFPDVGLNNDLYNITQYWDTGSSMWVNDEREISSLQDSSQTRQTWDGVTWQPVDKSLTSTGGGVTTITGLFWDGATWINEQRLSYSESFRKVETWDGTMWLNVQLQETTYNGSGGLLELLEKAWDETSMTWENDYRVTYTYDGTGVQTMFLLENWEDDMWKDATRQVSTLDGVGNEIEEVWQDWDDVENKWINIQRYLRTYEATGVGVERAPQLAGYVLGQNHPNPARTQTTIEFAVPAAVAGSVTLTLYDALGRRVRLLHDGLDAAGAARVTVSVDNLAAGVYYYQLRSGDAALTRRMVVSH